MYLIASGGSTYLNYSLKSILFIKSLFLNFLSLFSSVEATISRLFGDHKTLGNKGFLPNATISNTFFYKTRNSSSYLSYLSNISSYLSIISIFSDVDYKNFYKNKYSFFSYFYNLSAYASFQNSSRSLVNTLDLNSLESLYSSNTLPNVDELRVGLVDWFRNNKPELLECKVEKTLAAEGHKVNSMEPASPGCSG